MSTRSLPTTVLAAAVQLEAALGPDGLLGRHDKDLPTMWENAFYVGGGDPGRLAAALPDGPDCTVGAAVCWQLMRSGTSDRLRGTVDLMMTGSGWWSVPRWRPARIFDALERRNRATARAAAADFAGFVGAPLVHAATAGRSSAHCRGCRCVTAGTWRVRR